MKKHPHNEYLKYKYEHFSKLVTKNRFKLRNESNSKKLNDALGNPKMLWKNINEIPTQQIECT